MYTPSQANLGYKGNAVILLVSLFAAVPSWGQTCKSKADKLIKESSKIYSDLRAANDLEVEGAKANIASNGAINSTSLTQEMVTQRAAARSEQAESECRPKEKECKAISCPPPEEARQSPERERCYKKVKENCDAIKGAGDQVKSAAKGSGKTADASQSDPNQQSQQQQPQQQPQQQQPQQQPPTQQPQPQDQQKQAEESKMPGGEEQGKEKAVTDCSNTTFATSPECLKQKQEESQCKADMSNNSEQCRKLRAQSFCAVGSRGACPSCRGMTAQTFSTASASDLQNMCTGTCATDPNFGPNLADKCRAIIGGRGQNATTGLSTASASGGGSGASGGGGGASSGAGSQAKLDDNFRIPLDAEGSKEGQSTAPDASGGFAGYGGGGGTSGSLFGSDGGNSAAGGNKASADSRSLASSMPRDVARQDGMTIFRIFSEVIRVRCENGRLLHCGPYK